MKGGEFGGMDFALGSLNGVRAFRVDALGRLTGWSHKKVWTPEENESQCIRPAYSEAAMERYHEYSGGLYGGFNMAGPAPQHEGHAEGFDPECTCGFWAYFDMAPDFSHTEGLVGVVEAYGKTTIGTKGFRADKARILALALPDGARKGGGAQSERVVSWTRRDRIASFRAEHPVVNNVAVYGVGVGLGSFSTALLAAGHFGVGFGLLACMAAWYVLTTSTHGRVLDFKYPRVAKKPLPGAAGDGLAKQLAISMTLGGLVDPPVSDSQMAKVRRNYPDVKVYASVADMLAAHPLAEAVDPDPITDPEFWTRSPDAPARRFPGSVA